MPRDTAAPHRWHLDLLFCFITRGVELRGDTALTEAALLEVFAEESGAGEDAAIDVRERGMELGGHDAGDLPVAVHDHVAAHAPTVGHARAVHCALLRLSVLAAWRRRGAAILVAEAPAPAGEGGAVRPWRHMRHRQRSPPTGA